MESHKVGLIISLNSSVTTGKCWYPHLKNKKLHQRPANSKILQNTIWIYSLKGFGTRGKRDYKLKQLSQNL